LSTNDQSFSLEPKLAVAAVRLPVPADVALKRPQDFKLIGTAAKRMDTPAKVNGTERVALSGGSALFSWALPSEAQNRIIPRNK
jgi:hypothetical protein